MGLEVVSENTRLNSIANVSNCARNDSACKSSPLKDVTKVNSAEKSELIAAFKSKVVAQDFYTLHSLLAEIDLVCNSLLNQ